MAKVDGWDELKGEFEAIIESKEKELNDREEHLTAHDNARSSLVNLIKEGWEQSIVTCIFTILKSYKARINRAFSSISPGCFRKGERFKKIVSHKALLEQLNIFWSGCMTYASDGKMKEPLQKFTKASARRKEDPQRN